LEEFIGRHKQLALDTNCFIYLIHRHPRYFPLVDPIFKAMEAGRFTATTSTIALTELLVLPYREQNQRVADRCFSLLTRFPDIDWITPDLWIADRAAQARAEHNLTTPDAIQAATALTMEATGFVTNDRVFTRVQGLDILVLEDLLSGTA
jgi:predicted nucleic acid-binding protein